MTEHRALLVAPLRIVLAARLAGVLARQTIIVCGGVGAGKTFLLGALINDVPPARRLVQP